ncbi:TPA: hypothetical protein RG395_000054 [Legionella pneumophila]|nr:hypothetical protein [Legionella pneumophila]HAT1792797.1 hypothetical protein [Legionella pneumophila]HAT3974886.1 hypothetical protein [Legionella pneumophila]HAT8358254.1 hypothetical protein [Legionella pneumophila]HAU1205825.1 hypothetical protein [Legionella pneumophila]HAU1285082.1 hypothetical protein [Legionella pneumophila]
MIEDIDILNEMIKDHVLVSLEDNYDKKHVILREDQTDDSSVKISNMPSDALIIRADMFKAPKDFFNNSKNECKRADFIIISVERKIILFIEMKRDKGNWKEIVKQLMGADCLLSYCIEIGKSFWDKADFLKNFDRRYISICETRIPKQKTRIIKPSHLNDKPANALKISSTRNIQFNQLVG